MMTESGTDFLAMLIGGYVTAAGLGGLLTPDRWRRVLDDFAASPSLGLIAGVVAFIAGGAITAAHAGWGSPLAVIVSLVGWIGLAEGFVLLAFGDWWIRFTKPLSSRPRIWGSVTLVVGVLLFIAGLAGYTTTTV
jgi:uncharacterized protein YjeT (DUF2065 family)